MNSSTNYTNGTYLEDDPLNQEEHYSTTHLSLMLLRYVLFCNKILADILFLYAFRTFEVLRTWENYLIFHWTVVDLIHVFFQLIVVDIILFHSLGVEIIPCLLSSAISSLFVITLIFAFALLLNYFISNFRRPLSATCQSNFQKYYIYVIYVISAISYILDFVSCYYAFEFLMLSTEIVVYGSAILNIVGSELVVQNENTVKTKYTVYVSNAVICSFIPILVYHYLIRYFYAYEHIIIVISYLRFVILIVLFSNSMIICFILYKFNKDFNTVFIIIFKKLYGYVRKDTPWVNLEEDV